LYETRRYAVSSLRRSMTLYSGLMLLRLPAIFGSFGAAADSAVHAVEADASCSAVGETLLLLLVSSPISR
jgi:hypothetical protein